MLQTIELKTVRKFDKAADLNISPPSMMSILLASLGRDGLSLSNGGRIAIGYLRDDNRNQIGHSLAGCQYHAGIALPWSGLRMAHFHQSGETHVYRTQLPRWERHARRLLAGVLLWLWQYSRSLHMKRGLQYQSSEGTNPCQRVDPSGLSPKMSSNKSLH